MSRVGGFQCIDTDYQSKGFPVYFRVNWMCNISPLLDEMKKKKSQDKLCEWKECNDCLLLQLTRAVLHQLPSESD